MKRLERNRIVLAVLLGGGLALAGCDDGGSSEGAGGGTIDLRDGGGGGRTDGSSGGDDTGTHADATAPDPDDGVPPSPDAAQPDPDDGVTPPARDAALPDPDDGVIPPDRDAATPPDPDAAPELDAAPALDADVPPVEELPHFSFFVTSLRALQDLSGSQQGFGGDLRFGEDGPGAGLRGADRICATIAERSMPGAGAKQWHAFLSATDDGDGNQVNAIDRIGEGPWYDRTGRLFAPDKASLMSDRPQGGDAAIRNDFPNEDGVPNHRPDPVQPEVDNHDMLTGTNAQGQLYSQTATCLDWTSAVANTRVTGRPRVGHSWPRGGGGGRPGGGGSGNNWMSALDESGCSPGVSLIEMGPPQPNSTTVGSGGGYGGFYCFALVP